MTAIAVLGVPRSGTSLVAGMLHTMGVPMGREWLPMPDPSWQPESMWTDAEFNAVHQRLLQGQYEIRAPEHLDEYRALIEARDEQGLWGIKCHWLPFVWTEFLEEAGEVRLVKTWRCPDESIKSWAARNGLTYRESRVDLERWVEAVGMAWAGFAGPKIEVRFVEVVADEDGQTARLAEFVGVTAIKGSLVKREWKRF